MRDTRSEIIHIADDLIRSRGYNAFSYTDISKLLKLKNATIHYYFPSKSDLGVEVIRETMSGFKIKTNGWINLPYKEQLKNWVTLYDKNKHTHCTCIMGSLSPAYDTLSDEMKSELEKLANAIIAWLTNLLDCGKQSGDFSFVESPKTKAYLIQSSLLASLLLNKVMLNDAYQTIQDGILNT